MIKKLPLLLVISFSSVSLFAQPELCPPVGLTVFGGNQENIIAWAEPIGNIGCGDFPVNELPFSHASTNAGMGDDWPVSGSNGEDVAYTLNVGEATTFDFTLCNDATDYDTKIEIFTNDQDCITPVSTGNYNDDDYTNCPEHNAPYPPSGLWAVTLQPGQYYVVVDGYGGATGNYEISISVSGGRNSDGYTDNSIKTAWPLEIEKMQNLGVQQNEIDLYTSIVMDPIRYTLQNTNTRDIPEECGTFSTYRVYNATDGSILTETTDFSYTHSDLANGTEYCYYVTTVYDEGESEVTDTECGTPNTFDPLPPTNVYAEVWDEEVSLYWTAPEVTELGVPYYEGFEEGGLFDLWLVDGGDNWVYDDASGNPAPCMRFNWSPSVQNYDQSLYAPTIPIGELTDVTVGFDFEFDNWSPSGAEFLSIEYKTGTDATWNVIELFENSGEDFPFANFSYDVTGLTDNIQVRFHCYGATSFDLNWYLIDNFSVTSDGRTSRNEYDFLGYNVYIDDVIDNEDIFDTTGYTFYGLDNEVSYTFGVAAIYEGAAGEDNYQSEMITVDAQPVYVFGDVVGIITDPNGATLDSVIVSSGGASDTTGTDGTFTLWNLDVGTNTVTARRGGFYTSTEDVEVLAQADPTVQDFVLSPDMPSPVGLNATALDEQIYLQWRTPGGQTLYDMAYYDDELEAQIGCGGQCQFGVRFTPPNYPALLNGLVLSFQDGASAVGAAVDVYLDPDGLLMGPVGDPINLVPSADLSAPAELIQFEFDVSGVGVEITSGDIYIVVNENLSGFMGIANDTEPQSPEYYDRNWVSTGAEWATIFDVVAGDPGLTGDFGILVQLLGAPGRGQYTMTATGDIIEDRPVSIGQFANFTDIAITESETENPDFMTQLDEPYVPLNPSPLNVDRDDLIEYRVYEVDTEGSETFVVATEDTFATVTASPNYLEYCYNISAYWATDNYGDLESRHSNVACTVPYTLGDANFDSEVTINDVLEVVDFILEEDVPTEDQFRNCDVNSDEEINIADIVMMVDIIFGGTGRVVGFDAGEIAFIDLKTDFEKSLLTFEIEYNSPVRGIEFELKFDPTMVKVMPPSLLNFQENVMISYTEKEPGILKVLAADLQGGHIEATENSYMSIPVEFMGNERENSFVNLDGIKLAGADGSLINTVARTNSSEVKVIPGAFALHQNFPNPFNPSTEIRFDLPEAGNVNLAIYNLVGQKIRTLSSNNMAPGYHAIIWDGTNDIGSQVATGMYFYSIQSNEFQATKKMLFLK